MKKALVCVILITLSTSQWFIADAIGHNHIDSFSDGWWREIWVSFSGCCWGLYFGSRKP